MLVAGLKWLVSLERLTYVRPTIGTRCPSLTNQRIGHGQEHVVGQFGSEAGPQPGLVRRVFQQSAHEVGHAGNHLAHGHVFADPQTLVHQRLPQRIGHAIQLLKFDG